MAHGAPPDEWIVWGGQGSAQFLRTAEPKSVKGCTGYGVPQTERAVRQIVRHSLPPLQIVVRDYWNRAFSKSL